MPVFNVFLKMHQRLTHPMANLETFGDYIFGSLVGKIKFKLLFHGPLAERKDILVKNQ